ncbi:TetR family transcriptional regulator [Propionimicrobium sp. PCR01-08-3]|uniref:TetR family transcriptional regulator n=1 Tax=Propionimicrobium sp. PCR01-08-3 TaxID=3052086 RepID=UPI00255D0C48|nr:TetR family transcriptional regulator [Propionimicrobium sp. PCR01-08-3]WIY81499.1 TetR family transcriptional regulator [Propionimicrobium sp. PCR01-08-3]
MAVTKASIVDAALGILDQYGLPDLSMRRIADALGVQAAAIYWHIANKQTLLAAVSDAILSDQRSVDGQISLADWARDLRQVLLSHRDAAELVAASLAVGLCERVPDAAAIALLSRAGWSSPDAERAARAMVHFILAHVMQEQTRQDLLSAGVLQASSEALDEEGFELGLRMLIEGIARITGTPE